MGGKVRVGMIGVGQQGKRHVEQYQSVPDAQIVAICDLRLDEAQRVAQKYGVPDVYTDYHEMLKRDDIDSVDVVVHNRFHMPIVVDALRAGKNVYCEKPISWAYRDAKTMVDTAKEMGRMLHVQLAMLYDADTRAAKRLIDEGHLGDIYYCKSSHRRRRGRPFVDGYGAKEFVNTSTSGGGTMLDMAVYHISQMLYLLGNPKPITISGSTYQKLYGNMYADRREASAYNVEELGMGLVRLEGGITFFVEEAWALQSDEPESDYIYGSRAGLRVRPLGYFATLADIEMDSKFDVAQADWRWHQCAPDTTYYDESQKHWIAAQLGRVPLLDTAGIALATSFLTEGIYISQHLGREVTASEIAAAPAGLGRV
jgi:predicted dehydrogenase